jgi:multiple sugar transport system permease protein
MSEAPASRPLTAPYLARPALARPALAALRWRRLGGQALVYLVLSAGLLVAIFPFVWMVLTSLKDRAEASAFPPTLFPSVWHPENYVEAWRTAPWPRYFFNTLLVSTVVALGNMTTSTLAAYAFARLRFFAKQVVFFLLLATLMIPDEVTVIPNYVLIQRLKWINTYQALIVPFLAGVFGIFLLRQFFRSLPQDLFEAAMLDGAGHLQIIWYVVLPLSRPALITVALLSFLSSYNSFLWPLLVASRAELRMVMVGLNSFTTEVSTRFDLLMAASAMVILPVVMLFFVAQRYFVEGVTRTGLRG